MPEKLLTAKEVGEQLGVSDVQVYNLSNKRLLRYLDIGLGRLKQRRFTQAEVDRYIKDNTTKTVVTLKEAD